MAIITISRGSYSRGKEVAEKVAERLGYECISRDLIIGETAGEFAIPELKLERAIHDSPSILDRFTYGRQRFVTYFESALLEHVQRDDVVYHGLAGHFFLKSCTHVLKVRIIADMEDRVRFEVERNGGTPAKAEQLLRKDDDERRKWSLHLYGIDTADPCLYDLVIHIQTISVEEAVDMIAHTAKLKHFHTTPESQEALDDLVLASTIRANLIQDWPDVTVTASHGAVRVKTGALSSSHEAVFQEIQASARAAAGVEDLRVDVKVDL